MNKYINRLTPVERLICILILIVLFLCFSPFNVYENYSKGQRTGVVIKLTKTGLVWKTWEGEMNLGGIKTYESNISIFNAWEFSVRDENVVKILQKASDEGKRVVVTYNAPLVMSKINGESRCMVVDAIVQ